MAKLSFGGLLRKIKEVTGTHESKTSAEQSPLMPSPAPVPSAPVSSAPKLKRRAERVQVLAFHHLQCILKEQSGHKAPQIANVSTSGIGFIRDSVPEWPAEDSTIDAQFSISDQVFTVRMKVMHQQNGIVGCAYQSPEKAFIKALSQLFEVEIAALRLVRVKESLLKPTDDGRPCWYEGEKNCSLYFVSDGDQLVRFTCSFFGNCIEGGRNRELRFGQQTLDASNSSAVYQSRTMYQWEKSWPTDMIALAERFIESVPDLASSTRDQLHACIRKIPTHAP